MSSRHHFVVEHALAMLSCAAACPHGCPCLVYGSVMQHAHAQPWAHGQASHRASVIAAMHVPWAAACSHLSPFRLPCTTPSACSTLSPEATSEAVSRMAARLGLCVPGRLSQPLWKAVARVPCPHHSSTSQVSFQPSPPVQDRSKVGAHGQVYICTYESRLRARICIGVWCAVNDRSTTRQVLFQPSPPVHISALSPCQGAGESGR